MENTPILRSLVAGGRSSGTGRPTSSTSSARDSSEQTRRGAEFDREVERARNEEPRKQLDERRQGAERAERHHTRTDARTDARHVRGRGADEAHDERGPNSPSASEPATPVLPPELESAKEQTPEPGALELESFHAPKSTDAAPANATPRAELAAATLDEGLALAAVNAAEQPASTLDTENALAPAAAPVSTGSMTAAAAPEANLPADDAASVELGAATELNAAEVDATSASAVGESELQGAGVQSAAPSGDATPSSDAPRAPVAPETVARTNDVAQSGAAESPAEPPRAPLDSERAAEVLRQVRLRFSPELRQAVIQLEPRELGRISIKISVARGVVRTELRAESASALEALERHAPELQAALERVGLGGGSFALHLGFEGSSTQHAGDGEQQRPRAGDARPGEPTELEGAPRALAQRLAALSGVDTYA